MAPSKNGKPYKRLAVLQPVGSAAAAGLRYVSDAAPGIARQRAGTTFRYFAPDGKAIRDHGTSRASARSPFRRHGATFGSVRALTATWQATGRDSRGRKQYRYHGRWREVRDETKYERMVAFAKALPRIRRRVSHDLALPGLPRDKVLATVVSASPRCACARCACKARP